jgi:GAF domain-containing protein/HAMP domain-containing protein
MAKTSLFDFFHSSINLSKYRLPGILFILYAISTSIFYGIVYFQYHFYQTTSFLVAVMLSLIAIPIIIKWSRNADSVVAAIAFLASLGFVYGSNEMIWSNLTLLHLFTGVTIVLLSGRIILPNRPLVWMIGCALYVVYIGALNFWEPLPRLDQKEVPFAVIFSFVTSLLFVLAYISHLIIQYQSHSLRTRLMVTFILLVFLPVLVVGVASIALISRNAESQLQSQLYSILLLKQGEIQSWQENMQSNLLVFLPRSSETDKIAALVDGHSRQGDTENFLDYAEIQSIFRAVTDNTNVFQEIFLMDMQWQIVLSTEKNREGLIDSSRPYFPGTLQYITASPIYIDPVTEMPVQVVAVPIVDIQNDVIAILAGRANLDTLNQILGQGMGLGETGEIYLVLPGHKLLTPGKGHNEGTPFPEVNSIGISAALAQQNGSGIYEGYHGSMVVGVYGWNPELQVAIVAEQNQAEAFSQVNQVILITISLLVAGVFIAFGVGLYMTGRIIKPLRELAISARKVAEGDLSLTVNEASVDEIGDLARGFNSMTGQLRTLITSLEQRVAERTNSLEQRSQQLKLAAEVARDATALRNLEDLLEHSVNIIAEKFGYDFVGLYLVDERNEYAGLAAGSKATSVNEQNLKIKIQSTHAVGVVARTGQFRLIQDSDYQSFDPIFPDVVSRALLPLKVGPAVVGVLDLHSKRSETFSEDLMSILQVVADQLAIALDSAQLFDQMSATLRELELLTGRYTQQSWRLAKGALPQIDYSYRSSVVRRRGTKPLGDTSSQLAINREKSHLTIPLILRNQQIGTLNFTFSESDIDPLMVSTLYEISQRLVLLMENARLIIEARSLAAREQQINRISTNVRSSVNMDAILRNTVRELGKVFGASRAFIQIGTHVNENDGSTENSGRGDS